MSRQMFSREIKQPKSPEEAFWNFYKKDILPLLNQISEEAGCKLLKNKNYEEFKSVINKKWKKIFELKDNIQQSVRLKTKNFYSESNPVKIIKRLQSLKKSVEPNYLDRPVFIRNLENEEINENLSVRYGGWLSKKNLKNVKWDLKNLLNNHEFLSQERFKISVQGDSELSFWFTTNEFFRCDDHSLPTEWRSEYTNRKANFENYIATLIKILPWEMPKYFIELKNTLENYYKLGNHSWFNPNLAVVILNNSILNFIFLICAIDSEWNNVKSGNFGNLEKKLFGSKLKRWFFNISNKKNKKFNKANKAIIDNINFIIRVRNIICHPFNSKVKGKWFVCSNPLLPDFIKSTKYPWLIAFNFSNSSEIDNIGLLGLRGDKDIPKGFMISESQIDLLLDITKNTLKFLTCFQAVVPARLGTGLLREKLLSRFEELIC